MKMFLILSSLLLSYSLVSQATPILQTNGTEQFQGNTPAVGALAQEETNSAATLTFGEYQTFTVTHSCYYSSAGRSWTETCRDSCTGQYHETNAGCHGYAVYGANQGAWCSIRCW